MVPGSQCSLNSRFHRIAVLVPDAPGRSPVGSSLGCDGQFISWFLYLVLKFPVRILYIRAIYLLHCFSSLYLFFSFLYLFFKKQTSYFNVWEVAYCSSEEIPGLFVESTRKGSVVSRANSIGSTSASSVPNTGRRQHLPTRGTRCAFILVFFLDKAAPAFHMGALEP